MPELSKKDREYIALAFELAYFIHGNKGIAICVAEEAWRKLEHAQGRQDRRGRYALKGRQGRQDEPPRGARTKLSLPDAHLLQCLVYAESESWERCTEHGDGPYALTEEDMIIRFVKHLVRITLRRNSFHVTLGVGQLIYDYATSEVRRLYEFLMQDPKRFKDNPYLRRRRKVLMREIRDRFADQVQTVTSPEQGERLLTQPATPSLIELVHECLRRFMPWGVKCVLPEPFSWKIPALVFSGSDPDKEHPIETRRTHTILHPECFARLARGLGLDAPEERLAVPQFFYSTSGGTRGDRFHPPKLEEADYLRLQRNREELARRQKSFLARRLTVYTDDVECASFDPRQTSQLRLEIGPEADVVEVRGQDAEGELTLTTLLVRCYDVPAGESCESWAVLDAGQKISMRLTPQWNEDGELEGSHLEIRYAETHPMRAIAWLAQRAWLRFMRMGVWVYGRIGAQPKSPTRPHAHTPPPAWSWMGRVVVAVALVAAVAMLLQIQRQRSLLKLPEPPRAEIPRPPVEQPPSPPVQPSAPPETPPLMAQVTWSRDVETLAQALPIEPTRARVSRVDLSRQQTVLLIRLPRYDEESQPLTRYRVTLMASGKPIWQRTLDAPHVGLTEDEQVMTLTLFSKQLPKADAYELQVQGQSQRGWQPVGQALIQATDR